EEFEANVRVSNEFNSDDLTLEGVISIPVNEKLGLRLAVQTSKMDKGWIKNNADPNGDTYTTMDANAVLNPGLGLPVFNSFDNPFAAGLWWPAEETTHIRGTVAGDLTDRFSYNIKGSYARFEQTASSGGGELFDCPTLNGVAHRAVPVDPQPAGRQTTLFEPIALPTVDCVFDGARGINDVPPGVAATNDLMDMFGNGDLGEKFTSVNFTATFDYAFDTVDVQTIFNYQDATERWVSDFDGGGVTSIIAAERNTFDQFAIETRAVTRFDSPLNFVLGGYYQSTDRFFNQDVIFAAAQFTGPIDDPNDEFTAYNKESGTDGETFSVYGEFIWNITDRLELAAGARYIHETKDSEFIQPYTNPFFVGLFPPFDPANAVLTTAAADQTFKNLIPEVTLTYAYTDNITVYAAYKEGFKSGGFSNSAILSNLSPPFLDGVMCSNDPALPGVTYGSCFGVSEGADLVFRDFVFDEEQNKGGEIGVKASLFDNSMLATIEVFYYKFRDLQVDFFNDAQFAFVTSNAGGSETYGAELQVDWATPVDGLFLSGSFGWLESKYTDFDEFCYGGQTPAQGCGPLLPGQSETDARQNLAGNTRPGAPRWSGHFVTSYERAIGANLVLGITGNLQYKSETTLSSSMPTATYPSYVTMDANIRLGSQDGRWQVALIGKNLTDKLAIRGAGDIPETGGNTATPEGFLGDLSGGAIRPRQIELELKYSFTQ
ncbi:MAG: TonB-dependent receptor, partial [Pseudomonadales bacterium]